MTEWLVYRPKPFGLDIHCNGKCSSGYTHDLYGCLQELVMHHPDYGCEVSDWGNNYYKVSPLFLVRWEDDQEV